LDAAGRLSSFVLDSEQMLRGVDTQVGALGEVVAQVIFSASRAGCRVCARAG
jgi:hypothetical protein